MPGEDDELRLNASLDGDLAEALRRIEQRLDSVESSLESAGRAGERAGDRIESGADDAAEALARTERAASAAADELGDVERQAARTSRSLDSVESSAESAARELSDVERGAGRTAGALEDVDSNARRAARGLDTVESGADDASGALGRAERSARGAGRALDEAGDEAAEAGAQAAASSSGWDKLWRALDRNERISRRWAAAQDSMSWDRWTSRIDRFRSRARGVLDLDWGGGAKRVRGMSKAFASFGAILSGIKIMAVAGAIHFLLGAVSALGAGAVAALGGIGSMIAGLSAAIPLIGAAAAAMIAFKVAAEPLKDELDSIKSKFEGVGNAIAQGGMRDALNYLDQRIGKLAENVESGMGIIAKGLAQSTRHVADYASNYRNLQILGEIWIGLGHIVGRFGGIGVSAMSSFIDLMRASLPASHALTRDIEIQIGRLSEWMRRVTDSGQAAAFISASYDRLRRAMSVLVDISVGLFNVLRIGAQEAGWMGTAIEDAAAKFRAWTATAEGQNSIRQWFQDSVPAIRETGLLLRDMVMWLANLATSEGLAPLINQVRTEVLPAIGELLAEVTGQGGLVPSLLSAFTEITKLFTSLDMTALAFLANEIANAVKWLTEMINTVPGLSTLVSTLAVLWVTGGAALKVIAGGMAAFAWLQGAIAMTGSLTLAQTILGTVIGNVRLAAALAWASFQAWGGIPKVMSGIAWAAKGMWAAITGPIGLVVLAVTAVVAAFIWAYNNVEWFRNGVDTALAWVVDTFWWAVDGIVAAWGVVSSWIAEQWNGWIKPTLDAIWYALKFLGAIIFTILVAPFVIAWNLIAAAATWLWENALRPLFAIIQVGLHLLGQYVEAAQQRWNAAMNLIGTFLRYVYDTFIAPIFALVGVAVDYLAQKAEEGKQRWNAAMQAIGDFLRWVYDTYIVPIFQFFVDRWNWAVLGMQIIYQNTLVPLFNGVGALLNWLWTTVVQPVLGWIQQRWADLGAGLMLVKTSVIDPMFSAIQIGLGILQGWFESSVNRIGELWNGLRQKTAAPINFLIDTVWNNGILKVWNWVAEKLGLPMGAPIARIPEFATGGVVPGYAPGRDTVPAILSPGEAVLRPEVARTMGSRWVKQVNSVAKKRGQRGVAQFLATGGESVSAFADGGMVGRGQAWAQSQVGKPYVWGGVGPGGYDCSGAISALTNVLTGAAIHRRLFATGSFGPNRGAGGFVPGLSSSFAIGVSPNTGSGIGHMAGTLGGLNVESRGGQGFVTGGAARGATDRLFPWQFSLPQVGGAFIPGAGGGGISMWAIAKPILDGIINPIINSIPFRGPPQFMDIPKAMATTAKDKFYGWAEQKLNAISSWFGGGGGGSADVRAAVQAVATRYGWGAGAEWSALDALIAKESSWNPGAANPTSSARGLFQKMTSLHGPVEPTAAGQAEWGLSYIRGRYGSPSRAWAHHQRHNSYDNGGYLEPGFTTVFNGTGHPEPVFTSQQWDQLNPLHLVEAMHTTAPSVEARAASSREEALLAAIGGLSAALDERPPALAVSGEETKRAVKSALAERDRERDLKNRYRYGG